jgi:hypothetical protein
MPTDPANLTPSRRLFLTTLATTIGAAAAGAAVVSRLEAQASQVKKSSPPRDMVVYKDPNCGCCSEWIKHVTKAGFTVTIKDMPNPSDMQLTKRSFGVPAALESCHTGRIGAYTIEGHVPADLIVKLLAEKPTAKGLAVPGMPMGSPGMEGNRKDAYNVMLFDATGKARVYASR